MAYIAPSTEYNYHNNASVTATTTHRRTTSPVPSSPTRRATSPNSALSYAFKSNGRNDDRAGYIRASKKTLDIYYDLPGMADVIRKQNAVKGPAFQYMSGDRSSYLRSARGVTGLVYDLPGMGSCVSTRVTDFSRGSERKAKDLLVHSSPTKAGRPAMRREHFDVIYDLPGMADEVRLSKKGTASFRMTSPRIMYIPPPGPAHNVQLRSDAGTIAHETDHSRNGPRSTTSPLRKSSDLASAAFRMTSPRFRNPSPQRGGEPFSVGSYDVPNGMAVEVLKSPTGTAAFRNTTARDSYVKAFPKTSDLVYDIPGMSGVLYTSPQQQPAVKMLSSPSNSAHSLKGTLGGESSSSRAQAQRGQNFPENVSSPVSAPTSQCSTPRYVSPTRSSAAKRSNAQP